MITYIEGLKKDHHELYDIALPVLESFRRLDMDVKTKGFREADIELFEDFHNKCRETLPKLHDYEIPVEDWRESCGKIGGVYRTMFPYYWTTFDKTIRQVAHMSHLLVNIKHGALDTYIEEINLSFAKKGLVLLPLSVLGKQFSVSSDIPTAWVKSMMYMEIQFNILGKADYAARLWRQAFPHGMDTDVDSAVNSNCGPWWVDLEGERLVSQDWPPLANRMGIGNTTREDLCPLPEHLMAFSQMFPNVMHPFFGALAPYHREAAKSNQALVEDIWKWAAVYECIGNKLTSENYLVIPQNVSVFDYTTKPQYADDRQKIKAIVPRENVVNAAPFEGSLANSVTDPPLEQ